MSENLTRSEWLKKREIIAEKLGEVAGFSKQADDITTALYGFCPRPRFPRPQNQNNTFEVYANHVERKVYLTYDVGGSKYTTVTTEDEAYLVAHDIQSQLRFAHINRGEIDE